MACCMPYLAVYLWLWQHLMCCISAEMTSVCYVAVLGIQVSRSAEMWLGPYVIGL